MFVRLDGAEADGRPSYGFKRSGGERGGGLARAAGRAGGHGGDEENPPARSFLLLQTRYSIRNIHAEGLSNNHMWGGIVEASECFLLLPHAL